ncbi:hypothetical protein [Spelaeicoccus albus]|uniref:Uncharacterized protein n=1 Tax=Spelaeicoccus albus TaxID=1280376 RepID=A0A7Z0CZ51_9MICO|nr:hypothetical protein [Spelaeicoccus albus]NYI65919.1 hypothetical protein [Spelaeicoccus albus]
MADVWRRAGESGCGRVRRDGARGALGMRRFGRVRFSWCVVFFSACCHVVGALAGRAVVVGALAGRCIAA